MWHIATPTENSMKYRRVSLRLIPGKDDDVIAWLEQQENQTEAFRRVCRFYQQHADQSPMLRDIYEKLQRIEAMLATGTHVQSIPTPPHEEDPELAAALDALGER